jgi:ABC-type Fe3+ transport system permease subunit
VSLLTGRIVFWAILAVALVAAFTFGAVTELPWHADFLVALGIGWIASTVYTAIDVAVTYRKRRAATKAVGDHLDRLARSLGSFPSARFAVDRDGVATDRFTEPRSA